MHMEGRGRKRPTELPFILPYYHKLIEIIYALFLTFNLAEMKNSKKDIGKNCGCYFFSKETRFRKFRLLS